MATWCARPQIDYCVVRYNPIIQNVLLWKMNEFNHPGTTMLIADAYPGIGPKDNYISNMQDVDGANPAPVLAQNPMVQALQARHNGIGNVMFLDGHAEQHNYQDYAANIQPNGATTNVYSHPWTFQNIP